LRPPERHAKEVSGMENTSRSLPRRDDETEIEETVATTLEPSGAFFRLSEVKLPMAEIARVMGRH
jgi:hypothetical protein